MIREEFQTHRDAAGKRRRRSSGFIAFSKVDRVEVDRRVWRMALKLAGGDLCRIVVLSSTEVQILNKGRR